MLHQNYLIQCIWSTYAHVSSGPVSNVLWVVLSNQKRAITFKVVFSVLEIPWKKLPRSCLWEWLHSGHERALIGGKKRAVVVEWTQSEVITLLDEIQSVLPNDDNVKYSTMADRLEWDKIQVGHHTPAECKDQWIGITTKVVYHLTTLWSI